MSKVARIVLAVALILLPLGVALVGSSQLNSIEDNTLSEIVLDLSAGVIVVYVFVAVVLCIAMPVMAGIKLLRDALLKEPVSGTEISSRS